MEQPEERISFALPASSEQMWLASRLLQRQVVNVATLEPIGRVADIVFDPESCQLSALCIQPESSAEGFLAVVGRRFGRHRTAASVGLDHIISLHGDVVMVDSDPVRSAAPQPIGRAARLREVCELTILTLHGMCLGSLADLVLDRDGSVIVGYVVSPTKYAETVLPSIEDLLRPTPQQEVDASEESPTSALPSTSLRIIPASPRVRVSDSLIVVLEEAEPLQQESIAILSQPGEHTEHTEHTKPHL